MELAIFLFVISTALLASAFLAGIFVEQTIYRGRWQPLATGLIGGLGTLVVGQLTALAPLLTFVYLPVVATAIGTAVACRKRDWQVLASTPPGESGLNRKQNCIVLACGVATALVAMSFEIGRPMLLTLGYDVIGHTFEENRDVVFAGSLVGFLVGAAFAATVLAAFTRRNSQSEQHES